jgi:ABC-type bacteriocin/lantibiotic exporter with double-glycine peptidase domain
MVRLDVDTVNGGIMFDERFFPEAEAFRGRRVHQVRLTNDVDGVEDVVTDTVFGLFRNVLVTVATLGLMLRFSWPLTWWCWC